VDDDGDGVVDEDFGDVDADGVADCVDDTCALGSVVAGEVPRSEVCSGTATVTDPWTTRATSVWATLSTDAQVESIAQTPLVVQRIGIIKRAGFAADDLRPWSTWYRWILARQTPLDRPACRGLPDPARVSACEEMALIVYKGRLQLARDHGRNPCAQPVPGDLAYVPDPAVDTVRGAMGCR